MIDRLVRTIPKPITNRLKNTIFEDYYQKYNIGKINFIERNFTTGCGEFTISIPDYADDWYANEHEPKLNSELADVLSRDTTFYDIGSQFGYHIQFAKQCGVIESNIHSFEASKKRSEIIRQNFDDNRINITNKRVSDRISEREISIDEYISHHTDPDIIKIDVEGAEGKVIDGMAETLRECKPIVYIEIHPAMMADFGYDKKFIYKSLKDAKYKIHVTNHRSEKSKWIKLDKDESIEPETYLLRGKPHS